MEEFKQQMVDFYQAGSFVSYLSREYGVANVMIYNWIKESSHVQVSDTEEMTLKEYGKMKKGLQNSK